MLRLLQKYFALLVILSAFIWAGLTILFARHAKEPAGTVTVRIGHWQLEAGMRQAIDELGREYQALHPNVRVVQDAIPETTYGQWVSTNLMGGTAPDILEMGMGASYQVLLSYYNRYCIPLTTYVNRPNPYNKGTEFENTPVRQTYKDAMITGYNSELQEYMTVPLAQFAVRVFYNKDLLRQLTGRDTPPTEYRDFLAQCKRISEQKDATGRPYTAIVGSKYHWGMWDGALCDLATFRLMDKADFNRDGQVGNDELFVAVKTGRVSFSDPAIRARFIIVKDLIGYCQAGFTGLSRDEGVFLFAQQRAVFMTTGTWDARGLQEQAKGKFEVGIMDFPLPRPDDPELGRFLPASRFERPTANCNMAVTTCGKNPEQAIDFLMFLASKRGNEKLNGTIGWIPAVKNTKLDPLLESFTPNLRGIYSNMQTNLGGETWIKWSQVYSLFQVNKTSFEDLVKEFEPFYKDKGMADFLEQQKDWRRGMFSTERLASSMRAKALALSDQPAQAELRWTKYRALIGDRQVFPEITHERQMLQINNGIPADKPGPYEYSPAVLERIRKHLRPGDKS